MTLADVAAAVGGVLADAPDPAALVTAPAVLDSRLAAPGCVFVAVAGERADGHDYAAAAIAAGAIAVLAARPVGVPAVLVPDVVAALGRLARTVVDQLPDVTVVGITGSSGKTSTKDLLAAILAGHGPTVAPVGSWNNELGHPLTVLRADASTRHLVLECSARRIGNIAALCAIAPPRIGVVLNVGTAHLGVFGTRENIARAKAELVEALPGDGLAVLNADDPRVAAMAVRTKARVLTVGTAGDVRADDVRLDAAGRPAFRLWGQPVRLRLHGAHHVGNALAAATVARELGMGPAEVAEALSAARPGSRWRMEVTERPDGVTVVNDAYNANPESMRAALHAVAVIGAGRRRWAVLGPMAELGDAAPAEHERVGALAAELGIERLVAVGAPIPGARPVGGVEEAVALLQAELAPGDVVLVKASRAAGLERVAEALL
jgi:UDP-N-acetylmuramoyl-tripeptide--D-alanyl-D-alanine ligase